MILCTFMFLVYIVDTLVGNLCMVEFRGEKEKLLGEGERFV